ncbi:MAG: hypothetical protein KAH23_05815 [Kiritimatiellae bacterium]|nr:hypothetical protein [Kiritimatiellia bacterium]
MSGKLFLCSVVSALVCVSAIFSVAQEPVLPFTYMYDTGKSSAKLLKPSAIRKKSGWTELAEDDTKHQFKGDTVLVNNRIAVVVRKEGAGAEVYMLTEKNPEYRTTLIPEGSAKGSGLKQISVKIKENNPSGAYLSAEYKAAEREITIGYKLTPGEPSVTVHCDKGLKNLKITADIRYVLVPNFFGDDMVFTGTSLDVDSIPLPAEKMFLNMITGGNSIMMCVCEDDKQDCRVVFSGAGKKRIIVGAEVLAVQDKKIWISFLEDKGIWADHQASAKHAMKWVPPFSARWRLNVLEDAGLAGSFLYTKELAAEKTGRGLLVYPLERDRTTPYTAFCMRDIMKNTLGVGPCEYIISVEGLSAATPHEVTEWVKKLFKKKRDKRNADQIKERLDQMVGHIKHAQKRIDKYERTANQIKIVCANEQNACPENVKIIAIINKLADGINQSIVMKKEALSACGFGAQYSNKILRLIGKKGALAECGELSAKIQEIGNAQDRSLAKCRMAGRWLSLQCKELKEANPDVGNFLKAVDGHIQTLLVIK